MQNQVQIVDNAQPTWDGVLAFARALDFMTEGASIREATFEAILLELGATDPKATMRALHSSGLIEAGDDAERFVLSRLGRILVIHACCSL